MITVRDTDELRRAWNAPRFRPGGAEGHYESWFQRANHPTRPLAFWIRYTVFSPKDRAGDAVGELWAVYFDGESGRSTAVKEVTPLSACRFSPEGLAVRIGGSELDDRRLDGLASSAGHTVGWSLEYGSPQAPLLLLPRELYDRGIPRAKALVGSPDAEYSGRLVVDGDEIAIEGWRGSQNHNWGSRHTDSYAWGQVAGFDGADDVFLECSTAQLRFGPIWTPRMSLVVLRAGGEEYSLNRLSTALRSRGRFDFFEWRIESAAGDLRIAMHMQAPRESFVGLAYDNPPGGQKTCLNTKLAACELTLEKKGSPARSWKTRHRAAFEILTDRSDHGVAIVA